MASAKSRYGFGDLADVAGDEAVFEYHFSAEQLLGLAWRVAGATMAALGIPRSDLPAFGELVEPTINQIVREYGVEIPKGYRR
jgi:hypothetical protein